MTTEEYEKMLEAAERVGLKSRDLLKDNRDTALRVCNGIGAEWMPKWLRDIVTKLHPTLAPAAAIHDLRYYFGNGTDLDFMESNEEFADNGIALAKDKYGWYNPVRYIVIKDAKKFCAILNSFGWVAYLNAVEERKAYDEEQLKSASETVEIVEKSQKKDDEASSDVKKSQKTEKRKKSNA